MDRLTSMAVFRRAVELGSFAAAARQFDISPEMAGNQVCALERRLGVRLLNRSTRRLHLTEAGDGYYARCRHILAEIEEAEKQANALQAVPRGHLRIAVPVTFGLRSVTPLLAVYMTRYPEVTLEVAVSDRFVDLIEVAWFAEQLDYPIVYHRRLDRLCARRQSGRIDREDIERD